MVFHQNEDKWNSCSFSLQDGEFYKKKKIIK